jgi:ParB-like chromosome segregation protein Spo0J
MANATANAPFKVKGKNKLASGAPVEGAMIQHMKEVVGKTLDVDPERISFGRNPRSTPRTEADYEKMATQLRRDGQLQNIGVYLDPVNVGNYILAYGAKRLGAGKLMRATNPKFRLSAKVLNYGESENPELAAYGAAIAENRDRDGTTMVDTAEQFRVLTEEFKQKDADAIKVIGLSSGYIPLLKNLLKVDPRIQKLVREGKISGKVAAATVGYAENVILAFLEAVADADKTLARASKAAQIKDAESTPASGAKGPTGKAAKKFVAKHGKGTERDPSKGGRKASEYRTGQQISEYFAGLMTSVGVPANVTKWANVMQDFCHNRAGVTKANNALQEMVGFTLSTSAAESVASASKPKVKA